MGYLEGFGLKVFRLREAKESEEFILYNIKSNKYNQYTQKRINSILYKELIDKNIDWKAFCDDVLRIDHKVELKALCVNWIKQEYTLIDNLGYQPSEELVFKEHGRELFNIYKKSKLLKSSKKYEKGKFTNIKKLINNLVGHEEHNYNYFVNWLAWKLQNPLKRLPTSIILQGEHGTGKTKFCELVLKPIFEDNFREIGQADINKEYNDYILGKELIIANEVIHNDNKLLVPDKLKNYVTDEFISINRKFKDTAYMRNFSQWIFITNNFIPLKIEKGDRRYTVFKSKTLKKGIELIKALMKNQKEELECFVHFLLKELTPEYDIVSMPLENQAKKDIIKYSQNTIEDFIDFIEQEKGLDIMFKELKYKSNDIITVKDKEILIETSEFYKMYGLFCNDNGINHKFARTNFVRYLNSIGYKNKTYRDKNENVKRGIVLKGGLND